MKKKTTKLQYPGSNRHSQNLTNKDKTKLTNTYNIRKLEFQVKNESSVNHLTIAD